VSAASRLERPSSDRGQRLRDLVESLGCSFGLERSVKLSAGRINDDRYLISLDRGSIGGDAALAHLGRTLKLADADLAAVLSRVGASTIVHLGYEGGPAPRYKLYFELPLAAEGDVLVHLALKWPADGGPAAVNRYVRPGGLGDATTIARHLAARSGPSAAFAAHVLALSRARGATAFYLDVEEAGSARRSFDVNLYDAELTIAEAGEPLLALGRAYGLDLGPVAQHGAKILGHVSGGSDRSGDDFTTLYFGVEARHGRFHG